MLQDRDLLGLALHDQEQTGIVTLHVMESKTSGSHITIVHTIFGGVCYKYTYDYGITHANTHLKNTSANLSCISSHFRNAGNGSVAAPTKKKMPKVPGYLLKFTKY